MSTVPPVEVYVLTPAELEEIKAEAIRAFLKRVEDRLPAYSTGRGADEWLKHYYRGIQAELEAMEEERK